MVPRHTDAYSLCYSGEWLGVGGCGERASVPRPLRHTSELPAEHPPHAGLLMCRFAAPLAFNFMAAIALPESRGLDAPVGWVWLWAGGQG
jgi:hypothetical protein